MRQLLSLYEAGHPRESGDLNIIEHKPRKIPAFAGMTKVLAAIFFLANCSGEQPAPPQAAQQPQPQSSYEMPEPPQSDAGFAAWLKDYRARTTSVSSATFARVVPYIYYTPDVISLDRKQPESRLTIEQYLAKVINQPRIEKGRSLYREYQTELKAAEASYGVPASIIVALWGIESSYGEITGDREILPALATLAYEGRRRSFFEGELTAALKIIEQEHKEPDTLVGSWAGAMGQTQFMPTSYLRYAVDANGDGKRDIWETQADIFASIASYLANVGWRGNAPAALRVKAMGTPPSVDTKGKIDYWRQAGFWREDGEPLPETGEEIYRLWKLDGGGLWLIGDHFDVILRWNRSRHFAAAVSTLAEEVQK